MKEHYTETFPRFVEYDLASSNDYTRLGASCGEVVATYGDANTAYEQLGRQGIISITEAVSQLTHNSLTALKANLVGDPGIVILHGTGVDRMSDEQAQLTSIVISAHFGEPTKTDRRLAQIAWPIQYDPKVNIKRTFSQSLGEAAFHTDTQYFENPEDFFGLYCVRADKPGNGTNLLLNITDVVRNICDDYDPSVIQELMRPYPFRVPSVFTESASDDDVEINWGPILSPGLSTMRYRKDTIEAALRTGAANLDSGQLRAIGVLEQVLDTLPPISYHLEPGDAVLVNNLKILHARTYFDNPDRLLYRVRMREI